MNTDHHKRVDARRNALAVIDAARTLFAQKGVDVSMEELGRAAGVGKGTLYRHYPTRDHLYAAVSKDRFDRLAIEATALLGDADDAYTALTQWLREYERGAQQYRGLRAVLGAGIANEGSAIFADCAPMKQQAGLLLKRAQDAGQVRNDIEITDLLSMIAALPEQFRHADGTSPLLEIVLQGIATTPSA
jgi:AcrR family transcriptional regulator